MAYRHQYIIDAFLKWQKHFLEEQTNHEERMEKDDKARPLNNGEIIKPGDFYFSKECKWKRVGEYSGGRYYECFNRPIIRKCSTAFIKGVKNIG